MSLYAKINSNNIVENIVVCDDSQAGVLNGRFIKVTDDTKTAVIGGSYNEESRKFIKLKPYSSWELDANLEWVAPVAKPSGDGSYEWNEDEMRWDELPIGPLQPSPSHIWNEETETWSLPE
jgi:hypothetical protein